MNLPRFSIALAMLSLANASALATSFPDGGEWDASGIADLSDLGMLGTSAIRWNGRNAFIYNPGGNSLDIRGDGNVPLFRFYADGANLVGSLQMPVNGVLGFTSGTAALSPDTVFTRVSANRMALGNASAIGDHSGRLDLGRLTAYTQIDTPDGGYFNSAGSNFHNIYIHNGSDPGILGAAGAIYYDYNGLGTTYRSGTSGDTTCLEYSTWCMRWEQRFVANDGFQVWGLESGARDNHALHIGAVRAAPLPDKMSQLLLSDNMTTVRKAPHILINGPFTSFAGIGVTEGNALDNTIRIGGVTDTGTLWSNDPDYGIFNIEIAGGYRFLDLDGTNATCVAKVDHTNGTINATDCSGVAAPITAKTLQLSLVTVAALPTCDVASAGTIAIISDALSPVWQAAPTGGGAIATTVLCHGSAWKIN